MDKTDVIVCIKAGISKKLKWGFNEIIDKAIYIPISHFFKLFSDDETIIYARVPKDSYKTLKNIIKEKDITLKKRTNITPKLQIKSAEMEREVSNMENIPIEKNNEEHLKLLGVI